MSGRFFILGLIGLLFCQCSKQNQQPIVVIEQAPSLQALFDAFLSNDSNGPALSFAKITQAACGHNILAFDPSETLETLFLDVISSAVEETHSQFEQTQGTSSKQLTDAMKATLQSKLHATPELDCDYSRTIDGIKARSGYPDLRCLHLETGRVIYLSLKLVEADTLDSQLRTFFFRPGNESSRVYEDAYHLIVSFTYSSQAAKRQLTDWQLIDLSQLQVQLATEFQSSKQQLYQSKLVVGKSNEN